MARKSITCFDHGKDVSKIHLSLSLCDSSGHTPIKPCTLPQINIDPAIFIFRGVEDYSPLNIGYFQGVCHFGGVL